jgi:MFS family permease
VLVLAVSQFLDFRAIEIGSGYSAVQEIARAPRIEVQTPMDAHSILLLAAAALAAGCLAALVLGRRRIFATGLSLVGIATIAVTMLVDLPRGLDTEEAAIAFTGVAAVLLTGFWLQLAAGVVLTATGLLLAATGTGRERSANTGRLRNGRGDREPGPINGPDRADGSGRAEGPGRADDPRRTDGPGRVRERPA